MSWEVLPTSHKVAQMVREKTERLERGGVSVDEALQIGFECDKELVMAVAELECKVLQLAGQLKLVERGAGTYVFQNSLTGVESKPFESSDGTFTLDLSFD